MAWHTNYCHQDALVTALFDSPDRMLAHPLESCLDGLPAELSAAQREAAESRLIGDAKRLTLKDLRRRRFPVRRPT